MKRTEEETVDVDLLLNGCELYCLSITGWCVSESGGVALCELCHGGCKNNCLFFYGVWRWLCLAWEVVGGIYEWEHEITYLTSYIS